MLGLNKTVIFPVREISTYSLSIQKEVLFSTNGEWKRAKKSVKKRRKNRRRQKDKKEETNRAIVCVCNAKVKT